MNKVFRWKTAATSIAVSVLTGAILSGAVGGLASGVTVASVDVGTHLPKPPQPSFVTDSSV